LLFQYQTGNKTPLWSSNVW